MKTERLSVGAAIVKFLQNQYVARDGQEHRLINGVFGIFGHGNVTGLGQALEEYGGNGLPFYQGKNEQCMVHSATAFAKARRRLGTLACTSSIGPGATNMITGAATATVNRLPVLLLPGDIFASRIPGPVLQQLENPHTQDSGVNDCFKPVSKYWDRIYRPEQLLSALPEAMRVLADPAQTGAVTLCLPQDVQAESFDFPEHLFQRRVYTIQRTPVGKEVLLEACRQIKEAKQPLIVAGGGIHYSEAEEALRIFAEQTGIPVVVSQAGKGSLLESHPQCLGSVGATGNSAGNRAAVEADLVINIGTRLSDFTTASKSQFQNPDVRFIAINVHAMDAHKHGAFPMVGDARAIIEDLTDALNGHSIPESYAKEISAWKSSWNATREDIVHPENKEGLLYQSEAIHILNEFGDENSTTVHASGGVPGDIHKLWNCKDAMDYHSEYGFSCMGYEIAGAMGVKLADPNREVYTLVGDGSYMMLSQDIVTSIQEGLKITIVLLDNHGFQCIRGLQTSCGGNEFGNEFRHRNKENNRLDGEFVEIDFCANAKSMGAVVFRAEDEASFIEALAKAKEETRTTLIYVPIRRESNVPGYSWWEVPVSGSSNLPPVQLAHENYNKAKKKQRFYY
jgi:3D-(3,5/4)-trihydroxycyclohexane-1,2-dione acylhydrolase (decyclizing)